jgi:hypothetical protein
MLECQEAWRLECLKAWKLESSKDIIDFNPLAFQPPGLLALVLSGLLSYVHLSLQAFKPYGFPA